MSAEAENAMEKLKGEVKTRDKGTTEKNGEVYYESVVEDSDPDVTKDIDPNKYDMHALFEDKCAYDAMIKNDKDLTFTKREMKFDNLNFGKWSKDKHPNLWNFLSEKT